MIPKHPPYRNPEYIAWLRKRKCDSCGAWPPSDPSHCRKGTDGGTRLKPSDYYAVSQCGRCHRAIHREGYDWFEEQVGEEMKHYALWLWRYSPFYEPEHDPEGTDETRLL